MRLCVSISLKRPSCTRFELAFAASQLARFVSNPGEIHFTAAVRVLLYLKSTRDNALVFSPQPARPLEVYVDSDWSVKFSSSGAVFYYMGCLVHWFAKSQPEPSAVTLANQRNAPTSVM